MRVAPAAAVKRTIFLLLLVIPTSLFAQSGVWGARGITHQLLPHGNFVVDVDGRGVAVYDVSNPAKITRVAVADSNSETLDGALLDDTTLAVMTRIGIDRYAFGSDGSISLLSHQPTDGYTQIRSNGKWIAAASTSSIAIFTPQPDRIVQQMTIPIPIMSANVAAIALAGDALYVAQGAGGIAVYDLTSGTQAAYLPEIANDLAVSGTTLAIASGVNGLVLADVSAPLAPHVVGRTSAGSVNLARIAIGSGHVFAAESPSTVYEFDVTATDAPQLVKQITEPATTVATDGAHLFVSGTTFDRFGLPTETGEPLRVFDAATLTAAGTFNDLAGPVSGVATDGSLAYIVDRPTFKVIDISNTAAPKQIAALDLPNIQDSVKILGTQVILYGRGDVDLIDVSDPYHPRLVKVFQSGGRPPSNAAFARNTIIEGNPWSGFHVVDFASYPTAEQVGGIKGHYYEIAANGGDAAYIAGEASSITTVDLSDVHNPVTRSHILVGVKQTVIDPATGSHPDLLLVRSADGVHIYSLADPFVPAEQTFLPFGSATLIGAGGDTGYVVSSGAVSTLDLRDPAHPAIGSSGMTALSPMQIAVSGGKTVIADRYSLRVFGPDTAPPPAPRPPLHHRAARP